MRRRILYVIDSLGVGGAETLLIDLLDAAAARGREAHVAYFTPGPLEREVARRGIGATRLGRGGIGLPLALARAVRLMRAWRPDVVHTHLTKSDLVGQLAARATGVPRRVLTLHNLDPWRRNRAVSLIYRAATAGAQGRVAVSGEVAEFVAATGGAPAASLTVIDNGVDLRRFDPAAVRPLDLARWGVPQGATVVAAIGRLTPQKDHSSFLRAAAEAARTRPDLRFLVVGDGPLRPALEAEAAALGLLPGRLAFTGIVTEMPELLAAVDAVAFSSAWEGLPMTLLEAMAMARPVAATRVGGIPGAVADGREALLVPPGDPAALAAALDRLARDPALRERLGAAARATVARRYGATAMLDRLFAIYDAPDAPPPGPAAVRPGQLTRGRIR